MHRKIRNAQINDIPGILSVLEQNLLAKNNLDSNILEKNGFLIHAFTHEYAKTAINNKNDFVFLVAEECPNIIGYTIGCDITKLKSELQDKFSALSSEMQNIMHSEQAFYLRHIAKMRNTTQVGKGLLEAFLKKVRSKGHKYVICQIATMPLRNAASIAFHQKHGFICVGNHQEGAITYGIYLKKI